MVREEGGSIERGESGEGGGSEYKKEGRVVREEEGGNGRGTREVKEDGGNGEGGGDGRKGMSDGEEGDE